MGLRNVSRLTVVISAYCIEVIQLQAYIITIITCGRVQAHTLLQLLQHRRCQMDILRFKTLLAEQDHLSLVSRRREIIESTAL